MLGYVIPDKGELKVREYETYTGYYCGVCKYIGREYGQLPRMALSYDAAFLALLLACADPAPDEPSQEHCVVHHIKKKTVIRNRAIEYAGDVMLILAWYKLLDDEQDEGKVYAKAAMALLKRNYRKLCVKHPDLCEGVRAHLSALNALEKERCPSIDRVAEDFAQIMAVILREGSLALYGRDARGRAGSDASAAETHAADESVTDAAATDAPAKDASAKDASAKDASAFGADASDELPLLHETFANIGYHLGKWIYLIDAVDDIEENLQNGSYNPLFYRFDYKADEETAEQFRARIDEVLRFNLFQYLAVIGESLEVLDIRKNSGIIENVVYFGLNRRTEEVLKRLNTKKQG